VPDGVAAPVVFFVSEGEPIAVLHGQVPQPEFFTSSADIAVVLHGQEAQIEFSGRPAPPPGAYRMRGYDSTLGRIVYWDSVSIDELAAAYDGPGPVSDVVVFMFQGAGL
jgi:hypothetical protein